MVGLDPGITTGISMVKGRIGEKYSSGTWDAVVEQASIERLSGEGGEFVEKRYRETDRWWEIMGRAGIGLAMIVYEALVEEVGEDVVINAARGSAGTGDPLIGVCMEDFILRPDGGKKGIGGRDVLSPVALGSSFTSMWIQMAGNCPLLISSPSAKSLMDDARLKRWFPAELFKGKPHGTDAFRHALLGVRQIRGMKG